MAPKWTAQTGITGLPCLIKKARMIKSKPLFFLNQTIRAIGFRLFCKRQSVPDQADRETSLWSFRSYPGIIIGAEI